MTIEPKTITRSTYLQALGLFTMAVNHSRKYSEFKDELLRTLGFDPDDWSNGGDSIGDATWGGQDDPSFDEALKKDGIAVSDEPAP